MSAKLSQRIQISITYEMSMWLLGVSQEGGFERPSDAARAMLQTLMDEDLREVQQPQSEARA